MQRWFHTRAPRGGQAALNSRSAPVSSEQPARASCEKLTWCCILGLEERYSGCLLYAHYIIVLNHRRPLRAQLAAAIKRVTEELHEE